MGSAFTELHNKAKFALKQSAYHQAHQCCLLILKQNPRFADAWFLLAMIAAEHGQNGKAIELIDKALWLSPDNAEYLTHLARAKVLTGDHIGALKAAECAQKQKPASAFLLDSLGVVFSHIGLHERAARMFEQAVAKDQQNPQFYYNLATALRFTGDFNKCRQALDKTIALNGNAFAAHWSLAGLGGITEEHNHIGRLEQLRDKVANANEQLYLGHALAKEYESLGDYKAAFNALTWAKQAKLESLEHRFAGDEKLFVSLKRSFSSSGFLSSQSACQSDEPIFIVGMPRTGTTLLERILSAHPQVTSAGEMPHFSQILKKLTHTPANQKINVNSIAQANNLDLQKLGRGYIEMTRALTGKTPRFIDKMPLNGLYAGFILAALPNARILCLDRDPMDTVMSNYRQLFAANQGYYDYAYSLDATARYYNHYRALMQFWQQKFSANFMMVKYEQLVRAPKPQAQRIFQFCGLDWQDGYLNIADNQSAVATPSGVQIREGIHDKAIGNWRKYQPFIGDSSF